LRTSVLRIDRQSRRTVQPALPLLSALTLALAGCVTNTTITDKEPYANKPFSMTDLPQVESAVIEGSIDGRVASGQERGVVVYGMDGKDLFGSTPGKLTYGVEPKHAVRIPSGQHLIMFKARLNSDIFGNHKILLDAKPSKTYVIRWREGQWPLGKATYWIEDRETGEVVAR
jgi:hypothetical protein